MWLLFAVFAYFLISINLTLDKIILGKSIPSPVTYCFYMGLLSIFGLVFAPFGRVWAGPENALFGILVGMVFLLALFVMYKVLFRGEASRVGPAIGGMTPIFVSLLAFIFLGESFGPLKIVAFLFLVSGGLLISYRGGKIDFNEKKFASFYMIVLSAFLFGVYYILLKSVFNEQNFVSGFIWTRIGSFLGALLMLAYPKNREIIFGSTKSMKFSSGGLLLFNKTLSGVAFAFLNYAIFLGSVSIINAMQGLQYVFLFLLATFLSQKYPKLIAEKIDKKSLLQKGMALMLIVAGLFIIAYNHSVKGF